MSTIHADLLNNQSNRREVFDTLANGIRESKIFLTEDYISNMPPEWMPSLLSYYGDELVDPELALKAAKLWFVINHACKT